MTAFERDFQFYLRNRAHFNFDGAADYYSKKGAALVVYDPKGVSCKTAFRAFDETGQIKPTRHPALLEALYRTKGSVNLHIKMYAEDYVKGILTDFELREIAQDILAPDWFITAVHNQAIKIRKGVKADPHYVLKPRYEERNSQNIHLDKLEQAGKPHSIKANN